MDPRDQPPDVDPLAARTAEIDQIVADSPNIACLARGSFDAFVGQGFTPQQGLWLTAARLGWIPGATP